MKKWTQKEEDYLRSNASQTDVELGRALNRSSDSIYRKRRRLGIFQEPEISPSSIVEKSLKRESEKNLKKQVEVLTKELIETKKEKEALLQVRGIETYKIPVPEKKNGKSLATSISLASDWHYEEEVKSSQVNGLNRFNTTIAKERIEKFFALNAKLISIHQNEYQINNHILALLGDFISGSIHDDLKEGNAIQPTQAIWEVQNLIASGIEYLLRETNVNLIIPCSSGNHGRITEKQRVQTEYGNSLEILMYLQLQKYFEREPRVQFVINDSYLTYLRVFGFTLRFSHGHALKFSGGIGGLFIPAYKAISQWNKAKPADWDFFGHFHQLKDGGNFVSNGSLIGFNSYAVKIKADYERPKQFFGIIDEERGLDVSRKLTL